MVSFSLKRCFLRYSNESSAPGACDADTSTPFSSKYFSSSPLPSLSAPTTHATTARDTADQTSPAVPELQPPCPLFEGTVGAFVRVGSGVGLKVLSTGLGVGFIEGSGEGSGEGGGLGLCVGRRVPSHTSADRTTRPGSPRCPDN